MSIQQHTQNGPSFILVVPGSAANMTRGGGQRSAVFASALARCGPVKLLVIGRADPDRVDATFPDCTEIRFAPLRSSTNHHARTWTQRLLELIPRYRADDGVAAALDDMIGNEPAILVCRYFWPYCKTGMHWRRRDYVQTMIDIDDRDDLAPLFFSHPIVRRLQSIAFLDRLIRLYIQRIMQTMLPAAGHVWFVRQEDVRGFTIAKTSVAPNVPFTVETRTPPPSEANEIVLFVGSADHPSNVEGMRWFLSECWPEIAKMRPNARFRLIGSGAWGTILGNFWTTAADIVGFSEDLASEYAAARVVVAPVFDGGGSKIKVIEACAFGRPVVAARHSSGGFGREIEAEILTADDAAAFVAETTRMLADPEAADKLGCRLRQLQKTLLSREALEKAIARDVSRVAQLAVRVS